MAYSNGSGGTLTLPSPTHVHHVDVGSAVRSLRRSLSRSPSKFSLRSGPSTATGLAAPGTPSPEANGSLRLSRSTTPPTPAAEASTTPAGTPFGAPASGSALTPQPSHSTSTPFRSSVKLSLRSARSKPTGSRPLSRPRPGVSPKSPLKRVFGPSPDSGNPISAPFVEPAPQGQENPSFSDFALALSPVSRRNLEKPSRHSMHLDVSGSSKNGLSKFLGNNTDSFTSISVSPMKRSDAMSVDESSLGSPVAKRRSLHGISNLGAFNIFDFQSIPHQGTGTSQGFDIHEDANHEYQLTGSLASPFREIRDPAPSPTPIAVANMPKRTSSLRKSTLQQRHGEGRTSWGRRQGEKHLAQFMNGTTTPSRPCLNLDQYSSPDDRASPFSTQAPLPNPSVQPIPRPPNQPHPLSRTLTQSSSNSSVPDDSPTHFPIQLGERPRAPMNFSKSLPPGSTRPVDGSKPMATPDYKHAKPHQGAFASTGLVSKMNRNPELGPPGARGAKITAMPDTPCKKQYNSNTYPPQLSGGRRVSRPSFGSPSTPFSSSFAGPNRGNIFGSRDKPANLFVQPNRSGHARKVSLLSVDGDDHGEVGGSQDDFPPTPTKNFLRALGTTPAPAARTPSVRRASLFSQPAFGMDGEQPAASPSSSPLSRAGLATHSSPRTPQDSMAPPDPSRLSISNPRDDKVPRSRTPATPTTQPHKLFADASDRRSSVTPHNSHRPKDVDESLVTMFDKTEVIGRGEFSQVYRVVKSSVPTSLTAVFAVTPSKRSPHPPSSKEVYAVKKLRLPINGVKARAARLREVEILKALSHSDKIVHYIDSWEMNGHLYIQTEFCGEGSLDRYLYLIGQSGRLDQFRMWKILHEILQGLHAIHSAGFIHLDLKPANIFLTHDGYLKIGDFGMAVQLPAGKDVDGEGDREYIAPEILHGDFDKPADIFSLGLTMFEIACNVDLPHNGPSWHALRNGDLSAMGIIATGEPTLRDHNGIPLESIFDEDGYFIPFEKRQRYPFPVTHDASNLFGAERKVKETNPPFFMSSPLHQESLDSLIRKMLDPDPAARPTAEYLLSIYPIAWVNHRRTAGAIVYEGDFGLEAPKSEPKPMDDTVMTDV